MTITEVGCMGVKPGLDIMNDNTEEGQILTGVYKFVTTTQGGPYDFYWGLEIEDPSKLWGFCDWDRVEDHWKFAGEHGHVVMKDQPKILTHGEFTKHIAVTPFPPRVLGSPVTEVMLAYFPSDISESGKDAATSRFQQFKEKALNKCPDVKGVSSGWGVENDFPVRGGDEEGQKGSLFIALVGWPSIEAHMKFRDTADFEQNVELLTGMEGLVSLNIFHLSCRSLERKQE